jgi:hypothetical protein
VTYDDPDRLVLQPIGDGAPAAVPDDAEVCVCWPVSAGESLLPVHVHPALPPGTLLAPAGPLRLVQRRRHVRVREDLGVRVRLPAGWVLARTVNLSEAGLRCRVPATEGCTQGTPVQVSANVAGWTLEASGIVAHVVERTGRTMTVGIELLLSEREADQVRRHVYVVQRRELAARRAAPRRWPRSE